MCPLTSVTFGTSLLRPFRADVVTSTQALRPGLQSSAASRLSQFPLAPLSGLSVAVDHLCSVGLCSADYLYSICCAQQDNA